MRRFVKGWENFCKKLEIPNVEEKMITIFVFGICITRNEKFWTVEIFRSKLGKIYFGQWNEIFVL